jgi:L-arabinonolactonase
MQRIEVICAERDQLGEGPLWDVETQTLYSIDSHGRAVFRHEGAGRRRRWDLPERIGSLALRAGGGAICALRDGFHALDFDTGAVTPFASVGDTHPRTRLNDGKVDRRGRFLAGSMDDGETDPLCSLYRLDPDGRVTVLDRDIVCSNGPCWSLDDRTLYFADTTRKVIYAYDYAIDTGAVANRRTFVDFAALGLPGYPDGATVDAEGFIWCCEVYRGRLLRFAPDGTLDRTVGLPVESATSLTFGGAELDIAYVTSMARPVGGVSPREREAGMLFAVHDLGVRGVPEPRFAG